MNSYISYIKEMDFENDARIIYIGNTIKKFDVAISKYKDIFFDKLYTIISENSQKDLILPALLSLPFSKRFFKSNITKEEFDAQKESMISNYMHHIHNDYNNNEYVINKAMKYNKEIMYNLLLNWLEEFILTKEVLFDSIPNNFRDITCYIESNENLLTLISLAARKLFNSGDYDYISFSSRIVMLYDRYMKILMDNNYNDIFDSNDDKFNKYVDSNNFNFNIIAGSSLYDNIIHSDSINPISRISYVTAVDNNDRKVLLLRLPCSRLDYSYSYINPYAHHEFFFKILDENIGFTFQDLIEIYSFYKSYNNAYNTYTDQIFNEIELSNFNPSNPDSACAIFKDPSIKHSSCNTDDIKQIILNDFLYEFALECSMTRSFEMFAQFMHGRIRRILDIHFDYANLFLYDPAIDNRRLIEGCVVDKYGAINFYIVFPYECYNSKNIYALKFKCSLQRNSTYVELMSIKEVQYSSNELVTNNVTNKMMSNECYQECLKFKEKLEEVFSSDAVREIIRSTIDTQDEKIYKTFFKNKPTIYYNGNIDDFLIELNYYYNINHDLNDYHIVHVR